MNRSDLPKWLVAQGYKIGAEIGVYMGEFTKKLCREGLSVLAVDPWIAYSLELSQERQDLLYERAKERLKNYSNCTVIRKTSVEASKEITDGSLDFVFLDGDHSFKAIADDLVAWYPKIRKGGVMCGHDYSGESSRFVRPVVDAFVKAYDIKNLRIFSGMWKPNALGDIPQCFLWTK